MTRNLSEEVRTLTKHLDTTLATIARLASIRLADLKAAVNNTSSQEAAQDIARKVERAYDKLGIYVYTDRYGTIMSFPIEVGDICDRINVCIGETNGDRHPH